MLDSNVVPTSILDPPVRTLLLQRTRVKVERGVEGEDEMEFWPLEIEWPGGGLNRWRRGSIYSRNHPSRCSSSWGRMWLKERRQRDQVAIPVTASDAAIFGACSRRRVHLCTRRCRRGHLWHARKGRPTRVCLQHAYDVADAGISWTHARRPTRVSFNARVTWPTRASSSTRIRGGRRGHLLRRAYLELCSCTWRCRRLGPLVAHSCAM